MVEQLLSRFLGEPIGVETLVACLSRVLRLRLILTLGSATNPWLPCAAPLRFLRLPYRVPVIVIVRNRSSVSWRNSCRVPHFALSVEMG
jgi:hypothetical protein